MQVMTLEEIHSRIESLAQKVFEAKGAELVELKVSGNKNDVLIQIAADKSSGGITIGECAILNKSLVAAIEEEQLLPSEVFSLELSSPGLDRPLVTRKDFMRVVTQELKFWLNEPVNGKKEVQGILIDVGETELTVDAGKNKYLLPLGNIIKGMLVI